MKIVLLNTDDSRGGAARAAIRLHRALLERGDASTLLVRRRTGLHDHVPGIVQASEQPDPPYARLVQEWYIDHRRTEASETIFSGGLFGVDVADHPAVLQADILNLHWVAGFLRPSGIGKLLNLNKPVLWTLHDQWPMTGGCHYTAGCRQFTEMCRACPQLEGDEVGLVPAAFLDRLESFGSRITAVTPSDWLARQARASRIFRDARVEAIPNAVDHDVFRPLPKLPLRQKFGIPANQFVMLFACSAGFEKRKGIPLFRALLKEIGSEVFSLFVGWHTAESGKIPGQKHFGFVNDDALLCEIYNAADVLVHLASEDNLPNMPLEAMACGTPVLGLRNGGLPEIVDHQQSGLLTPAGDFVALVSAAQSLMHNSKLCASYGAAARGTVEKRFTRALQASRYAALYSKLAAPASGAAPPGRSHVAEKMYDLLAISAEWHLREELNALQEQNARLERRIRKLERNIGYRVVSGLANSVRNLGRALRGKSSGRS